MFCYSSFCGSWFSFGQFIIILWSLYICLIHRCDCTCSDYDCDGSAHWCLWGQDCTVTCDQPDTCSSYIIYAPNSGSLTITCTNSGTCNDLTIYGNSATTKIDINCNGWNACNGVNGIVIHGGNTDEIYFGCNGNTCQHPVYINGSNSNYVEITTGDSYQAYFTDTTVFCPTDSNLINDYSCVFDSNTEYDTTPHTIIFYSKEGLDSNNIDIQCGTYTNGCISGDSKLYCDTSFNSSCTLDVAYDGSVSCQYPIGMFVCIRFCMRQS